MSGSLIGGVVGAVIGSFIPGLGTMAGFMIGSTIGGLLFPGKGPDGPRLSDLKPQASEYGRPITKVFGTIAIPGNVIWASEYVEEADGQGGGCGEPSFNTFSYYGNFAVLVCVGEKSLGRIWAGPEKRLIYDGNLLEGADSGAEIRFYSGTEDQLPDPLIESYEGVGNVPGWRGWAYVVFEHFPLVNDGNMIPFLTIEVGAEVEPATDIGTVWTQGEVFVDEAAGTYAVTYSGTTEGVIVRTLGTNEFVRNFQPESWAGGAPGLIHSFMDRSRNVIYYIDVATIHWIDLDTGEESGFTVFDWPGNDGTWRPVGGVYHNGNVHVLMHRAAGGVAISVLDADDPTVSIAFYEGDAALGAWGMLAGFCGQRSDGDAYILGITVAGEVRKFPLSAGFTSTSCGDCVSGAGVTAAVDPSTGYVWSARIDGGILYASANDPVSATQLMDYASATDMADFAGGTRRGYPWIFDGDNVLLLGTTLSNLDYIVVFHATAAGYLDSVAGTNHGLHDLGSGFYDPESLWKYWFVRGSGWTNRPLEMGSYLALADIALLDTDNDTLASPLPGVHISQADAAVIAQGQPLDEVVAELSEMAGFDPGELNLSALADDIVDGYAIATQTTVREAISALQPVYYFDLIESAGGIKAVKRGGDVVATIPPEDLGAYEDGSQPIEPSEITRAKEEDLPQRLTVGYLLAATNYSKATKYAKRLTGSSRSEESMDFPLVLTDTKAQEVAEVNLYGMWVARIGWRFTLPYEYAYLEPTDCIAVGGKRLLIKKITQSGTIFKVEAASDGADIYTPEVIVTETTPIDQEVFEPSETLMELM